MPGFEKGNTHGKGRKKGTRNLVEVPATVWTKQVADLHRAVQEIRANIDPAALKAPLPEVFKPGARLSPGTPILPGSGAAVPEVVRLGYSAVLGIPVRNLKECLDLIEQHCSGIMFDAFWRGCLDMDTAQSFVRLFIETRMGKPRTAEPAPPTFPMIFQTRHPIGGNYDPMNADPARRVPSLADQAPPEPEADTDLVPVN